MKIRYRVWDPEENRMWYPDKGHSVSVDLDGYVYGLWDGHECEWKQAITVLSTGLEDADGREIFEGDVIEIEDGRRGQVIFIGGAFECQTDSFGILLDPGEASDSRVIGNIYENPKLLEG